MSAVTNDETTINNAKRSETSPSPALLVSNLNITYPATRRAPAVDALKNVSLQIPQGQSVALLGPNGSGKSTLMKIISGLIPADSGNYAVYGQSNQQNIRRQISVVFQSNGLDPHLTVNENLKCQAALYGLHGPAAQNTINEELNRAALTDKQHAFVKALSLGLARRVDLVRALLHRPKLLMLDEPTVGLDPVARANFLEEVERRKNQHHLTILMTTHLIDEANRCERCIFIHNGKIAADGSPGELRREVGGLIISIHGREPLPENITTIDQSLHWTQTTEGWQAMTNQTREQTIEHIAAHLAKTQRAFTIAPPTLADVFAKLTGVTLNTNENPT